MLATELWIRQGVAPLNNVAPFCRADITTWFLADFWQITVHDDQSCLVF